METTSFFIGALASAGVVSMICVLIYLNEFKRYKDRFDQFSFIAEESKQTAELIQKEYDQLKSRYIQKAANYDALKKANEDLREQVRIQAEKAMCYKVEIESLRSGKPMYEKRIKPVVEEKPKAEKKPTKRGKNIRGADGKWVKNIGQTVEKKTPLNLGF